MPFSTSCQVAQQTSQLRAKFRAKSIAVEVASLSTMFFGIAVELTAFFKFLERPNDKML